MVSKIVEGAVMGAALALFVLAMIAPVVGAAQVILPFLTFLWSLAPFWAKVVLMLGVVAGGVFAALEGGE